MTRGRWRRSSGSSASNIARVKVILKRSGGFAGISKSIEVEADDRLVHAVLRHPAAPHPRHPDGFTYELIVDGVAHLIDDEQWNQLAPSA